MVKLNTWLMGQRIGCIHLLKDTLGCNRWYVQALLALHVGKNLWQAKLETLAKLDILKPEYW